VVYPHQTIFVRSRVPFRRNKPERFDQFQAYIRCGFRRGHDPALARLKLGRFPVADERGGFIEIVYALARALATRDLAAPRGDTTI
jgi:hypothetical protein